MTDWHHFPALHRHLQPPLRPSEGDVSAMRCALAGRDGKVLLLGVTPELSVLGNDLTAVDGTRTMLELVWPGDREDRRAMLGDWRALPFADANFDSAIGDGSLNCLPGAMSQVFIELRRVLVAGGIAAFRLFASPPEPETLEVIQEAALAGEIRTFAALKWRVAMVLAAGQVDFLVRPLNILATVNRLFPDRRQLARVSGWSINRINTIDAYIGASHVLGFPTVEAALETGKAFFSSARVVQSAGYPLAERCPLIVWTV